MAERTITDLSLQMTEAVWTFRGRNEKVIDFVLVWDKNCLPSNSEASVEKRKIFELNLRAEGLKIENDFVEECALHFVKIYASHEVLCRYTEILKLRMPMREQELERSQRADKKPCFGWIGWFKHNFYVDKDVFPDFRQRYTAIYSRDKEFLFDSGSPEFFTQSIRSRIVQFILNRTWFQVTEEQNAPYFGIDRLLASDVYAAAYPLHAGDLDNKECARYHLLHHWASVNKWYRDQPIDHIHNYFGVKIGFYFAWLGFYTRMLLPAAIVGVICFIISLINLPKNKPQQDICSGLDIKMCPLWDYSNYWELDDTCFVSKITFLFDNDTAVFFAVFMSIWAAMFLEMWKRYSAAITHRWDLTGFDPHEDQPRPQYLARISRLKAKNKALHSNSIEPTLPFWKYRFPPTVFSFSVVLLFMTLALVAVIGVILYRMAVLAVLSVQGNEPIVSSNAIIITQVTAALINLSLMLVLSCVYDRLANYLTELEMQRTRSEFDDSLTLKMYMFQFVNYYSSIFYMAFCKGNIIGSPTRYYRWFGHRQEECNPGGCLLDLSIQLAIVMIGKQVLKTCLETVYPVMRKWWYNRNVKQRGEECEPMTQWEKDYKLLDWGPRGLFYEYLEMVVQYGFVTIFVSAFPLAPLFALLNNIIECRLDARKLLTHYRRPVAYRVRDIGVWFAILGSVSKLAVVTNAFIIAFTSKFVDRLVYSMVVSPDGTLAGYVNYTLAYASVQDLDMKGRPNSTLKYCRYEDYREPPWEENKYDTTHFFWYVLAAKLAFVLVFEHLVLVFVMTVQWIVPDTPALVRDHIRREAYITNQMIVTHNLKNKLKQK